MWSLFTWQGVLEGEGKAFTVVYVGHVSLGLLKTKELLCFLALSLPLHALYSLTPIANLVWYVTANLSFQCMISCHLLICP